VCYHAAENPYGRDYEEGYAGAVDLDPDVQAYFPDAEAINVALRGLMALIPAKRRAARKAKRRSDS
jgi:hypothetical protein